MMGAHERRLMTITELFEAVDAVGIAHTGSAHLEELVSGGRRAVVVPIGQWSALVRAIDSLLAAKRPAWEAVVSVTTALEGVREGGARGFLDALDDAREEGAARRGMVPEVSPPAPDEPPCPVEFDPGPEADDEGGMSEFRYHHATEE